MTDEEYMIPGNIKYIEKWKRLIAINRRYGRDHQVRDDYLDIRERIMKEKELDVNGFYADNSNLNALFAELRMRIAERNISYLEYNL